MEFESGPIIDRLGLARLSAWEREHLAEVGRGGPPLWEGGAAGPGLAAAGRKGDGGPPAAVAAGRGEELARTPHAPATAVHAAARAATGRPACRAARRTTARLVHETTGLVELLLARGPDEFLTAVLAGQGLVREAHGEASSLLFAGFSSRARSREDCLTRRSR